MGGDRVLVSLTHGREHAAAAVLVLRGAEVRLCGAACCAPPRSFVLAFAGYLYLAYAPAGDFRGPSLQQRPQRGVARAPVAGEAIPRRRWRLLLQSLDRHGIAYVYPHLIPFNGAGRLPLHSREQMRSFLAVARRVAPG